LADYYRRIIDYDDYMLNPSVFAWLNSLWGPHSVNQFAISINTHIDRFNDPTPGFGLQGQMHSHVIGERGVGKVLRDGNAVLTTAKEW